MSGINNLTHLSQFRRKSALCRPNADDTQFAVARLAHRELTKKAPGIGMKRLVGMLLANTARIRRMMQPRVHINIQVRNPKGVQAVKLSYND